jgi:hypothetical protein
MEDILAVVQTYLLDLHREEEKLLYLIEHYRNYPDEWME